MDSRVEVFCVKRIMIGLVRGYQKWISPLFPPSCIYRPTCSTYMIQAIEKHGVIKGVTMGFGRILRCHPFILGGQDPVPDEFTLRRHKDYRKKRTCQCCQSIEIKKEGD